MKTHGHLFQVVTAFANLVRAAHRASLGKRFRGPAAAFNFELERNLLRLQEQLQGRAYRPGRQRVFRIFEPKERIITAPAYRDRVVHHALCSVIEPLIDRTLIFDSYACRRGKGTHRAIERFARFARASRYVLHLDVEKYFPTIDHDILKGLLRRKIRDRDVLWLCNVIIDRSPAQEAPLRYFSGDTLLTPLERRKGLPIGSLTSQVFANLYLSQLDHFVKEHLRWRRYLRYMDDLCFFDDEKRELHRVASVVEEYLDRHLRLTLHKDKALLQPTSEGLPFLGFLVFPDHRRLLNASSHRYRRKLRRMSRAYSKGLLDLDEVTLSVQAWVAHASFGNTRRLRHDLLGRVMFPRREAVQAAVRGGAWNNGSLNCRSANRNGNEPTNPNDNIGFRLVAAPRTSQASSPIATVHGCTHSWSVPRRKAAAESRPPSWPASASAGGAKSLGARTVW